MTWPPPTIAPLPPPTPPPSPRTLTARPIAAWLAATGGGLVLVAAVVVVAGNWHDVSPALKFAGLVTVTVGLGLAAERARAAVPATARAVAHLAAALVAPVGIAAAAVAGATWPACVITGGVLAGAVCEVQARRWRAPLLDGAAVVAIALALVGLAAVVPLPVGVLAVIVAGGLLAARRDVSAAALAAAAAASPVLVALAEERVGDGTLARIGATGDVLAWSAPLVGVLGAGVLAIVATRRNAPAVAVMAMAAPLVGVTTGLATRGAGAAVWLCLPGIALAALELVTAVARTEPWRGVSRSVADAVAAGGSAIALVLPLVAAVEQSLTGDVPVLPLVLGASALAMTVVRTGHGHGELGGFAVAGTGALLIAVAAASGWPLVATAAVAAVVAWCALIVAGPRWLPVLPALVYAAGFLLAADGQPALEAAVGLGVLIIGVELACRARPDRPSVDAALLVTTFVGAAVVASTVPGHLPAAYLGALAVTVVVVAARRPLRAPALLFPVSCAGAIVVVAAPLETWTGAGVLALAIGATVTWWRSQELWTAHLATVLTVAALPFGLIAIGATSTEVAGALVIVAVVLTGTSFLVVSSGPVATAGMAASTLAAIVAPSDAAVLVSVAVAVVGIQLALEGLVRSLRPLTTAGGCVAAVGAASTWWTSGAHDTVLGWLEPLGVTGGDLGIAALSVLLLAAGTYAGRARPLGSWVTAGPAVGLVTVWLLDAQLTRDVGWSVPLALATGIVAVGAGGWRRLAAPLILGTAGVATTIVVSAGPRLAELDSWMWLAAGGIGLIALAVLVERTVGPDRTPIDWRRLRSTWR